MAGMAAFSTFLRDLWRLARPYWSSEERWAARGLATVIVVMSLALVALNLGFNRWYNAFYTSLQNYDARAFWRLQLVFAGLAAGNVILQVYRTYLMQMLRIRWRRWLTDRYIHDWLEHQVYYNIQMRGGTTDNPDQRIADDIDGFCAQTINLLLGLLEQTVTLVSFGGILWGLSSAFLLPLFGAQLHVPGYMLWGALIYAIFGTGLTFLIGRPLIGLNFQQQRLEADFRFSLVRFRENVEGIALYRGEADEAAVLRGRFARVVDNWWGIMRRQKRLGWFTFGFVQTAALFPFILAAAPYFGKTIALGGLLQTVQAFGRVQDALSWFVSAFTDLATWKATVDRLTSFRAAVEEARARAVAPSGVTLAEAAEPILDFDRVELDRPDGGGVLVEETRLRVEAGEHVLISGPTGAGKSSLFRAVAGLWRAGRGRILLPLAARVMFLPQKAYLPIGSLRAVASYPAPANRFTDQAIVEALTKVGLGKWSGDLDDARYWAQQLSPGEQQRLAFARVLLHQPDWIFLDEASAALDEAGEASLYRLLRELMPRATIISIGHRSSLAQFHERRVELRPDANGIARLAEA